MLYRDLINYEAVESIIQLKDSSDGEKARELVRSYVISEEMSQRITEIVIPQLQYDTGNDSKAILVVGNYGTGKSHLLAVISSLCAGREFLKYLTDETVKKEAEKIAGKFKVVIRTEIGGTTMPLRELLLSELQEQLQDNGVEFSFPPLDKTISHKRVLEDMMTAYHKVYPDSGLLMVVDELLDYLRTRDEQELIRDLIFLREIGESCKDLRFRFITGVQEAIFDSHRFNHVADSIRRVKDRFEQVLIARKDVKYVVAHRLLHKTKEQERKIKEYLLPFAKFYGNMNEKIDELVRLFPIHPNYIDTFESVSIIEKREVLRTISITIKKFLDHEVPSDRPGIISYDSYWNFILENSSYRTISEVKEVIDCNKTLTSKIETAFTRPLYKDNALRIINGLSLHRLTTGDVYNSIGLTANELRDTLCLFDSNVAELGGSEPEKDLATHVETVLREILKTVDRSFISENSDNGQYYLDLKKTEDYDAKIESRAETLSGGQLDSYYFEALERVMELTDIPPYRQGFRIWQYELTWKERNAPRAGYLFFGAPNERSTTVPQRDYYLYFIQPFNPHKYVNDKLSDEVYFYLKNRDAEFDKYIRYFAASRYIAETESGYNKSVYSNKADNYLNKTIAWLQQNIGKCIEVEYKGISKPIYECAKGKSIRYISGIGQNETLNFKALVDTISSLCLSSHFQSQAPGYPSFSVLITGKNKPQAVAETLRVVSGGKTMSKQAAAILDGLELLEEESLNPSKSKYAQYVLKKFADKNPGEVVNRDELISAELELEYMDPHGFRLEPEWVLVILAALVHSGDIEISIPGQKFDTLNLTTLAATDIDTLMKFKHISTPADWNIPVLKKLFELQGLPQGYAKNLTQGKNEPIQALQDSIYKNINKIILGIQYLNEGLIFWEQDLLSYFGLEESAAELNTTKTFLESLQPYNTAGKLKKFPYGLTDIEAHKDSTKLLQAIRSIRDFISNQHSIINWLLVAQNYLPVDHQWQVELDKAKEKVFSFIKDSDTANINNLKGVVNLELMDLKKSFIETYSELHSKVRLNKAGDEKKAGLLNDYRLKNLKKLTAIDILPRQQLHNLLTRLSEIKSCFNLTEHSLQANPICPHCNFNPITEQLKVSVSHLLNQLDTQIESLLQGWTKILLSNLAKADAKQSMELLKKEDKSLLLDFIKSKDLPEVIEEQFIIDLKQVFSGLERVVVNLEELLRDITTAGGSLSLDELRKIFDDYIKKLINNKDEAKLRIVLE